MILSFLCVDLQVIPWGRKTSGSLVLVVCDAASGGASLWLQSLLPLCCCSVMVFPKTPLFFS